jgi:hypothetical protein
MGFVLWNTEAYCYISGCHRQARDGRLDNTKTCFDSLAQLSVGVFMLGVSFLGVHRVCWTNRMYGFMAHPRLLLYYA